MYSGISENIELHLMDLIHDFQEFHCARGAYKHYKKGKDDDNPTMQKRTTGLSKIDPRELWLFCSPGKHFFFLLLCIRARKLHPYLPSTVSTPTIFGKSFFTAPTAAKVPYYIFCIGRRLSKMHRLPLFGHLNVKEFTLGQKPMLC